MDLEEKENNLIEILEAAKKLDKRHQTVVTDILGLIEKAIDCSNRGDLKSAIKDGFGPLIMMLAIDFIRKYVAENLSPMEAMSLLLDKNGGRGERG